MSDLHKALADIGAIRQQLAAGTLFRGFGPAVIATSGGLALAAAALQSVWLDPAATDPVRFIACWVAVAALSAVLIGVEMVARSHRHHGGLATEMILHAIEQFLPAGAAGVVLALVFLTFSPKLAWLLPGLWQILVALGLFASLRFLPRAVAIAAAWYFVAGVAVLIIGSETETLSPWLMGWPFGLGQLLLATTLHLSFAGDDVETD